MYFVDCDRVVIADAIADLDDSAFKQQRILANKIARQWLQVGHLTEGF
jgi:hypothetical protein